MSEGRCRWCGADILWLVNDRTGKPLAVHPEPVPDGPIVRVGEDGYHVLGRAEREFLEATAAQTPAIAMPGRYTDHFSVCGRRADATSAWRR